MLTTRMKKFIEASMANPKVCDRDLAKQLGISYVTVSKWRTGNEEFNEEYDKALKKQWSGAAKKAQKKMIDLIDSPKDDVALRASQYVLSSNGYDAPQKIEAEVDANIIKVTIDDD